jgi:hypothetical protein
MLDHTVESSITAKANWFVGEIKNCTSTPLSAASNSKRAGYALSELYCDGGLSHQVEISFWGREEQLEYLYVEWKCRREESKFTCYELSGISRNELK